MSGSSGAVARRWIRRATSPPCPATLSTEIEHCLRTEVLARRFPLCVDENGGFHQELNRRWRPLPESPRSVVYQARMTWAASTVARRRDDLRARFTPWADHGMSELRRTFHDADHGGVRVHPGRDERHSYGVAFAIYAAAARARLDGDVRSRELALELFEWWEAAYDADFGTYAGPLDVDGSPLGVGSRRRDLVGVPFGSYSTNTHVHVVEALTELLRATGDDAVRSRLAETVDSLERWVAEQGGRLFTAYSVDGTPIDRDVSYGHDIEAVFLALDAHAALDRGTTTPLDALVEPVVRRGIDRRTGSLRSGRRHRRPWAQRHRSEWAQMEALNTFSLLAVRDEQRRGEYLRLVEGTWTFIRRVLIDPEHGGLFAGSDGRGRVSDHRKSHRWFACYHSVRAMLGAADRLADLGAARPGRAGPPPGRGSVSARSEGVEPPTA